MLRCGFQGNEYLQTAARCLQMMLRVDEYRHMFVQVEGVATYGYQIYLFLMLRSCLKDFVLFCWICMLPLHRLYHVLFCLAANEHLPVPNLLRAWLISDWSLKGKRLTFAVIHVWVNRNLWQYSNNVITMIGDHYLFSFSFQRGNVNLLLNNEGHCFNLLSTFSMWLL